MRVAVIGGGPSGLATLKYLVTAHEFFPGMEPIEARLFEAEASVGGTFKHRSYEDAEVSPQNFIEYSSILSSFSQLNKSNTFTSLELSLSIIFLISLQHLTTFQLAFLRNITHSQVI